MTTLWHGRFETDPDAAMFALNASLPFDRRMAEQDVRGSLAWAAALKDAGVLTPEEHSRIAEGLQAVLAEFRAGKFPFTPEDEDIHTAVERRLGELVGPLAGKLHTGRSRNDQVATDFRLWLLDALPNLQSAIRDLQAALLERAEAALTPTPPPPLPLSQGERGRGEAVRPGGGGEVLMPGYTHLQRAQPVLLSHWFLSHFWPLQRDRERLADLRPRLAVLPLGCGALAGTPYAIDRAALAAALGFDAPAPNSMDAVADRDFAAEFLFAAALTGVHLSKLAEQVILYTSAEFGFFTLDDAFGTGSSLMPQKKNPDPFELARGKAGRLLGYLTGLLTTLKGLPSTYDKDLQEDKEPVFAAFDTLMALLPVLAGAIRTLTAHPDRMESALDDFMLATDLADYLVGRGIPFREAHALTGQAVRRALEAGVPLGTLSLSTYRAIHPVFDESVYQVFDPRASVARRKAVGGTAPEAVEVQIQNAKGKI
ncbi:MAG TPA: argininosuccinate lyase [Chloroflexi bacterium]|nr:argininosuccinate lyase [Chloroflexota bacterium]